MTKLVKDGDAIQAEEAACHRFAGRVLIAQDAVDAETDKSALRPSQVIALHDRTHASWEAVAVRAAESATTKTAVLLIREPGAVAFAATSSRMPHRWPRDSPAQPGGPISRALTHERQQAVKDIYRWEQSFAEQLYCDTEWVHDHLAIAVLGERPSDGRFDILEELEPSWQVKEEFCLRCGEERNVGWCDTCKGRRCHSCGSCGCDPALEKPLCPNCYLRNPRRPGADLCRDCEQDLA